MLDHCLSAGSNLLVLFAFSASKSTATVASFSLVFGVATLVGGAYRMLFLEPLLAEVEQEDDTLQGSILRISLLVAVAVGASLAPFAWGSNGQLWLILAFGLPVLLVSDSVRYFGFCTRSIRGPLLLDGTWCAGSAMLFLFRGSLSPSLLFGGWIVSAAIGLGLFGRSSLRSLATSTERGISLGIDRGRITRVVEQGSSYLTGFAASAGLTTAMLFLLAHQATTLDVAIFRMAVAVGGISSLMTAALYAVLVPRISAYPGRELPREVVVFLFASCLTAIAAVALSPDSFGSYVFGDTWPGVQNLKWLIVIFIVLKFAEVPRVARLRASKDAGAVMRGRLAASFVLFLGLGAGLLVPIGASEAFGVLCLSMGTSLLYWMWQSHVTPIGRVSIAKNLGLMILSAIGGAIVLVPNLWLLLSVSAAVVAAVARDLPSLMKSSADTAAIVMASLGILGVGLYPFYRNGGVIMSSLDPLTDGERIHTLLVFLAAAAAMLIGGRIARMSGPIRSVRTSNDELLENLRRFAPILIVGTFCATVLFSFGFGLNQLVDRDSYIPPSYASKELMAGLNLLLLPCMGALGVSRELSWSSSAQRSLSALVAVALFVLAFAVGGRELAAMPPAFFLASFAIRTSRGYQPKGLVAKVAALGAISLLLYPVPVALRQLESHGLAPYSMSLVDGTMADELGDLDFLVGTVMFSIPMLTITERSEAEHWAGDLGAAANPLPGRYSSWGEREHRLQYIRFSDTAGVPLSALGTISAGGWLVLVSLFLAVGVLLENTAARASWRYGPIVGALSMSIGGLFSILVAQYTSRQAARYLLLLLGFNIWCRRPSSSVGTRRGNALEDSAQVVETARAPSPLSKLERRYVS